MIELLKLILIVVASINIGAFIAILILINKIDNIVGKYKLFINIEIFIFMIVNILLLIYGICTII